MEIALEQLGYGNVYHMSSIFDEESHARFWIEAIEAKYGSPRRNQDPEQLTATYWDRILADYDVSLYSSLTD